MTMKNYEFTLRFRLPAAQPDPKAWLDRLHEAGCDDATVGVGRRGFVALAFEREAASAAKAVSSAVADARRALRGAELIAAEPDLVNLADLAKLAGCTRQNLRKYASGEIRSVRFRFPPPTLAGPDNYWRLAEVGTWFDKHTSLKLRGEILDVAYQTSKINLKTQEARLRGLAVAR